MNENIILNVLKDETQKTVGCTDPGAVALAVATAAETLGDYPEKIVVEISENVYKNGITVGIPGTNERGVYLAAAIGSFLGNQTDKELEILDCLTEQILKKSKEMIRNKAIIIKCISNSEDPLYIKAIVTKNQNNAWAVIKEDYANITEKGINGNRTILNATSNQNLDKVNQLIKFKLFDLIEQIKKMEPKKFDFLMQQALINKASFNIAESSDVIDKLPKKKLETMEFPDNAKHLAEIYTFSTTLARMEGLKVPIISIAGSGNHGITNYLGVLAVAEALKVPYEELARALAISSIITIYIKGYIKRMTAFCGCSVAASTGVAAATVYLLKGTFEDMVNAMHTVIGALGGIICDGAKESCAYKISTAVSSAIEYAYLATKKSIYIDKSIGIISNNIEDTFAKLGLLNNPGMVQTDKCIVNIIQDIQKGGG